MEWLFVLCLGAFLPALIPLANGRIMAFLGVSLLCGAALLGLLFFIVPGVIIWCCALIVGLMSASNARKERLLRQIARNSDRARR